MLHSDWVDADKAATLVVALRKECKDAVSAACLEMALDRGELADGAAVRGFLLTQFGHLVRGDKAPWRLDLLGLCGRWDKV